MTKSWRENNLWPVACLYRISQPTSYVNDEGWVPTGDPCLIWVQVGEIFGFVQLCGQMIVTSGLLLTFSLTEEMWTDVCVCDLYQHVLRQDKNILSYQQSFNLFIYLNIKFDVLNRSESRVP